MDVIWNSILIQDYIILTSKVLHIKLPKKRQNLLEMLFKVKMGSYNTRFSE